MWAFGEPRFSSAAFFGVMLMLNDEDENTKRLIRRAA